jgi:hypothetical protein
MSNEQPLVPPAQPPRPPRQSHIGWIIVGVFRVCVIAACIGALVLANAAGNGNSGDTGGSQQSTATNPPGPTATTVPTATTAPTGPQPIFAPVLGGTVNDFIHQYGRSENPADNTIGAWQQITVAGYQVMLLVSAAPLRDSHDGQPHIEVLSVQAPSGVTWSAPTQAHIWGALIPSDATFVGMSATNNSHIYKSAELAATFTADIFTNNDGTQTVAPGTLFEQCLLGQATVQAGRVANTCFVTVGVY